MAAIGHKYDNSSASGNARAHFGDSYTDNRRDHSHELSNNRGNININYAADTDVTGFERNQRLLTAAAEGQTRRVNALLKLNADVEFRDEQGLTALHHAVLGGYSDIVEVMLERGADINARTAEMGSPLCLASLRGDLRILQVLLDARAEVDLSDGALGTALHCACFNGNLGVARALVEKGASLDKTCQLDFEQLERFCCTSQRVGLASSGAIPPSASSGAGSALPETWSPLFLAAWRGSSDVLRLLLAAGCQANRSCGVEELTPLMAAARCGDVIAGRMLIQNNANINAYDRRQHTALHHASEIGHEAFVKLLLGACAQLEALDNASRTPILVAAASNRTAIVRLLAISGANLSSPDSRGSILLHFAMQRGDSELAQVLADEATKRRGSWRSRLFLSTFDATAKEVFECIVSASEASSPQRLDPINVAAKKGLANAIPVLHSLGARATSRDAQTWTAAHHAAQSGNLNAFRLVLELGAALETPTDQRETALAIASRAGHSRIVRDALERGADPDVRNTLGLTPLHLSAASGHAKTVQILTSKVVNPSAKSIAGDSALHYASRGGYSFLFPVLLGKGLDPNLPNNAGRTAYDDALDAPTRAALLTSYQSRILSAQAKQAPAMRAAPAHPPATALTAKPQASVPAPIVHGSSEPDFIVGLATLFGLAAFFVVFLVALPAILVACCQLLVASLKILGTIAIVIAILATFWAVMPNPSAVAADDPSETLLTVIEGFWKVFLVFYSLFVSFGFAGVFDAPGVIVVCLLCALPWLALHWWAALALDMGLGPAFLISGLVCFLIFALLSAFIREIEREKTSTQTVTTTK